VRKGSDQRSDLSLNRCDNTNGFCEVNFMGISE